MLLTELYLSNLGLGTIENLCNITQRSYLLTLNCGFNSELTGRASFHPDSGSKLRAAVLFRTKSKKALHHVNFSLVEV